MRGKKFSVGVRAALAIFALTMFVRTVGATAEKGLSSFDRPDGDGIESYAGLIFDAAGNLYGTTISEGAHGPGTAFQSIPKAGGGSREGAA
jgi:uncharacterized repeat protein (TIGR03803 family)